MRNKPNKSKDKGDYILKNITIKKSVLITKRHFKKEKFDIFGNILTFLPKIDTTLIPVR